MITNFNPEDGGSTVSETTSIHVNNYWALVNTEMNLQVP